MAFFRWFAFLSAPTSPLSLEIRYLREWERFSKVLGTREDSEEPERLSRLLFPLRLSPGYPPDRSLSPSSPLPASFFHPLLFVLPAFSTPPSSSPRYSTSSTGSVADCLFSGSTTQCPASPYPIPARHGPVSRITRPHASDLAPIPSSKDIRSRATHRFPANLACMLHVYCRLETAGLMHPTERSPFLTMHLPQADRYQTS